MGDISTYMRISNLEVTDSDVDSRKKAAASLKSKWQKISTIQDIANKAACIADALGGTGSDFPDELASEVQIAIQKNAAAFLYEERPLEVGICSGVAVMEIFQGAMGIDAWTTPDLYAAFLWSALSFQPPLTEPKRESLRSDVLQAARKRMLAAAELGRKRTEKLAPIALPSVTSGTDPGNAIAGLHSYVTTTVRALFRNAALDREELDFLWWSHSGYSQTFKRPFSQIEESTRLVALGIEAGALLRRLPCDMHRDLVLKMVDTDPQSDLKTLLETMGELREVLASTLSSELQTKFPQLFPLCNAIKTNGSDVIGGDVRRSSSEWGARALLEAGLLHVAENGPGVL